VPWIPNAIPLSAPLLTLISCVSVADADAIARSSNSVLAHTSIMSPQRKGPLIPSDSYFPRALSAGPLQSQTWSKSAEQIKTAAHRTTSSPRRSGWPEEDATLLSSRLWPPTLAPSEVVYFSRAASAGCFPTGCTSNSSRIQVSTIPERSSSAVVTALQQRSSALSRSPDRTPRAPRISSGAAFYSEIVSRQQRSLSPFARSSVRR